MATKSAAVEAGSQAEPMGSKLDRALANVAKLSSEQRARALVSAGVIRQSEVSRVATRLTETPVKRAAAKRAAKRKNAKSFA